jgi:hypothetical protein
MTAVHISPNVFSLREFLSTHRLHLTVHTIYRISFILIIHHIHTYIHIFIYMSRTQLHFFRSSWQAGCSRILVSVTVSTSPRQWYFCQPGNRFAVYKVIQFLSAIKCSPVNNPTKFLAATDCGQAGLEAKKYFLLFTSSETWPDGPKIFAIIASEFRSKCQTLQALKETMVWPSLTRRLQYGSYVSLCLYIVPKYALCM